jgi:hypothetical protein
MTLAQLQTYYELRTALQEQIINAEIPDPAKVRMLLKFESFFSEVLVNSDPVTNDYIPTA